MTAAERIVWNRIQRRVATMQPEVARAILKAFAAVRDSMTEAEIVRAIQLGGVDRLFTEILTRAVLDVAYAPVRETMRTHLVTGVKAFGRVIPAAKTITISFDFLNPRVIDAIRELETKVITSLDTSVRETIRAIVENGLRDGVAPRTTARAIRSMTGLAPNQLQEVQNLRDAMLGQNGRTLSSYTLRHTRYDRLAKSGEMTPAQMEKALETYTKRRVALNANSVARTAANDTQKLAQRLSWGDAIEKGIVDGDRLVHEWVTVGDNRVRDEHAAMNGEVQPWDQPYSNGQLVPGETDYNCRCIDRFYMARAG